MELFHKAKAVRLRSHHDKYLSAEEDEDHVHQDRDGSSPNARWTVEYGNAGPVAVIRLISCYRRYLTASNEPFLLGMTGKKVLQTVPRRLDSSVEWEPIREGFQLKLKTRYGHYLRANGGLPPWRNSVTHDIPHRTATQDWVLWDVDIVEIRIDPASPIRDHPASFPSHHLSRRESSSSSPSGSPHKSEGRVIYYAIADGDGNVDGGVEQPSFTFKGTDVNELMHRLKDETEIDDLVVCSKNPLNGQLYPLLLDLPPNNTTMHVVVVMANSKVAKNFKKPNVNMHSSSDHF
ncbi:Actin-crosslinking proteins protein [Dioscorea alata]|uniref:Actin-crosslinking proteins protein n=1 Tax=Dioscorea alata TaxID=55571 RepID=A0ACB7UN18_DIOAL|nr:Actin-crosslinking proteins protein [Dioscorea alata]